MTTYTYAQLMGLWINNGGPRAQAPLAAAIAEAESRGNSQAINPTDNGGTQTSWGLWQISNGTHGQPVPNILNPAVNAQQAVAKYNGAGHTFTPWGTYQSGAYKPFLSPGASPNLNVASLGSPAAPGTSAGGGGAADCLFGLPAIDLGVGSTPQICFISRSEARGALGATLMVLGGGALALGVVLLAAYGLKSSAPKATGAALEGAGAALAVVPGAEPAGVAVAGAGRAARKRPTAEGISRTRQAQRSARFTPEAEKRRQAAAKKEAAEAKKPTKSSVAPAS